MVNGLTHVMCKHLYVLFNVIVYMFIFMLVINCEIDLIRLICATRNTTTTLSHPNFNLGIIGVREITLCTFNSLRNPEEFYQTTYSNLSQSAFRLPFIYG